MGLCGTVSGGKHLERAKMNIKKMLFVGGTFNDEGGKGSGYVRRLFDAIDNVFDLWGETHLSDRINGGHFEDLRNILESETSYDVIFWFANVPNTEEKLLKRVKETWPKAMLVMSKRNDTGKYTLKELVFRALGVKANLIVEFFKNKNQEGLVYASVFDPLGNAFGARMSDYYDLAEVLVKRLMTLMKMKRFSSVSRGNALPVPAHPVFFQYARKYADKFHELIHTEETTRFLGNASFRCENGFPSFRDGGLVFVSRRNLDKRMIGQEGFVAVDLSEPTCVVHYGDVKPSVDAAIQAELYRRIPWANFMLHSHVYIAGAPMTKKPIPCGAFQEVDEIMWVHGMEYHRGKLGEVGNRKLMMNLKGHGSLVIAESESAFSDIPYVAREFPEVQE